MVEVSSKETFPCWNISFWPSNDATARKDRLIIFFPARSPIVLDKFSNYSRLTTQLSINLVPLDPFSGKFLMHLCTSAWTADLAINTADTSAMKAYTRRSFNDRPWIIEHSAREWNDSIVNGVLLYSRWFAVLSRVMAFYIRSVEVPSRLLHSRLARHEQTTLCPRPRFSSYLSSLCIFFRPFVRNFFLSVSRVTACSNFIPWTSVQCGRVSCQLLTKVPGHL